jgi:hypothetical protein
LLLLFPSFSFRRPSRGNNDELRQMCAKSFHEFEGMLMNNAYGIIFGNFSLALHIPSLGPKVERHHHSSVHMKELLNIYKHLRFQNFSKAAPSNFAKPQQSILGNQILWNQSIVYLGFIA